LAVFGLNSASSNSSIQFPGVYGIHAVELILPEIGISGITRFARWLTQIEVESDAHIPNIRAYVIINSKA